MEKSFVVGGIIFLLLISPVLASFSYTEYDGTGDYQLKTDMKNMEDQVTISAEGYSGLQYITDDECYGYDICSYDESYIDNGCVDQQQTVTNDYDSESSTTIYNTGLFGTGSAYSAIYSNGYGGYGYQYSYANDDTYAYFTQTHTENDEFDYEASYGGGTLDCDDGEVYMENSYYLLNSPTYFSPVELIPTCYGEGCVFVYLYGDSTDILVLDAYLDTLTMSWYNGLNMEGPGLYDMCSVSDDDIEFDFEMVIG